MNPYAQFPFFGQPPKDRRLQTGDQRTVDPDLWISRLAYLAIERIVEVGHGLGKALRAQAKRRRAIDQLTGLDDDTLKDIGLHRSEVRSAVEEVLVFDTTIGTELPRRRERIVRSARSGHEKPQTGHQTKAAA